MNLTPYQKNVLAAIDKYVVAYLAKYLRKQLRQPIRDAVLRISRYDPKTPRTVTGNDLTEFMQWLPRLGPPWPQNITKNLVGRSIVYRAVAAKLPPDSTFTVGIAEAVISQMAQNFVTIEMQCQLPPTRVERVKRDVPATVVGKRAVRASAGLQLWESRLKYAQNKVKKYRRKVNYYTKKGVI